MTKLDLSLPEAWGWNQSLFAGWASRALGAKDAKVLLPGRVVRRELHSYSVVLPRLFDRFPGGLSATQLQQLEALSWPVELERLALSGRSWLDVSSAAAFPAVGDWVLIEPSLGGDARIHAVLPRFSQLSRTAAGEAGGQQVLAANIDTLFLVSGLDGGRNFSLRLLERMLTAAWNSGASPVLLLNKADLADSTELEQFLLEARSLDAAVPVYAVSAQSGEGLGQLSHFLKHGQTAAMLGKSGVGKSALLQALLPDQQLRIGQQRADLQGRHTTSSSRLYSLPGGGMLIDSPGIRELRLWADADDLDQTFSEISQLAQDCHFADCSHKAEPGCAVQAALASGQLPLDRFEAYLDLGKEVEFLRRRRDSRAEALEKAKWKSFHKAMRKFRKPGR